MRGNLGRKVSRGGSEPFQDPYGLLLEFPIFGRGGATEWMILELDPVYLREFWLPELVSTYLNREGHAVSDVRAQAATGPAHVVFSLGADPTAGSMPGGKTVSLRFNHRGRNYGDAPPRRGDHAPFPDGDALPRDGLGSPRDGDEGPPADDRPGSPSDGSGPFHDRPGLPPGGAQGRWLLVTRRHAGALEADVAAFRWRSFTLTGLLTGLTLAAGLALVH